MKQILRYWRDLPKEEKQKYMNGKPITYKEIKKLYLLNKC